jgi:transcriptional regulator GlxA family with amidase domain
MANHLQKIPLFAWTIVSPTGEPVSASNGLNIDTVTADSVSDADIAFVVGGTDVMLATAEAHLLALRRYARLGCQMGSLCTGAYALAKAGLLAGYTCTAHWENIASLREEFPDIYFVQELYVIDRDRVSCSGGVAPLDLLLKIVNAGAGPRIAEEVAQQFMVTGAREGSWKQCSPASRRTGSVNAILNRAISVMDETIEDPISREELARMCGVSQRQLQRIFKSNLGTTPSRHYVELRLRRARQFLLQTNLPLLQIAMACGFQNAAQFSIRYKEAFGLPPIQERRARTPASHRPDR